MSAPATAFVTTLSPRLPPCARPLRPACARYAPPILCSAPAPPPLPRQEALPPPPRTAAETVRTFWAHAATGRFSAATELFALDAVYHDTLYPSAFRGQAAIGAHLRAMEKAMPGALTFVVDSVAADETTAGARWHAETAAGRAVPLTRGASMYVLQRDADGAVRIAEAWDFPETPLKVAPLVLPVLRAASAVLRWVEGVRGRR